MAGVPVAGAHPGSAELHGAEVQEPSWGSAKRAPLTMLVYVRYRKCTWLAKAKASEPATLAEVPGALASHWALSGLGAERHGRSARVWSATQSQECQPQEAGVASCGAPKSAL